MYEEQDENNTAFLFVMNKGCKYGDIVVNFDYCFVRNNIDSLILDIYFIFIPILLHE